MSKINKKIIGDNARNGETDIMKNITIKQAATINAKGKLNSRKCKPVICIDTGEVYTSATDAAQDNGTTIYGISTVCLGKAKTANGKRFCYVQDFPEHISDITSRISAMNKGYAEMMEKAKAYDAMIAEQKEKEKEAEAHEKIITKAKEKLERRKEIYARKKSELDEAYQYVKEAERELETLTGTKKLSLVPYEIIPKDGGYELTINGVECDWVPNMEIANQCIDHYMSHKEKEEGKCSY